MYKVPSAQSRPSIRPALWGALVGFGLGVADIFALEQARIKLFDHIALHWVFLSLAVGVMILVFRLGSGQRAAGLIYLLAPLGPVLSAILWLMMVYLGSLAVPLHQQQPYVGGIVMGLSWLCTMLIIAWLLHRSHGAAARRKP